jgi:hypothetical protein
VTYGPTPSLDLEELRELRPAAEMATALGTIVSFERDGVSYVVAGLVPPVAAENAARGLR